jgi:hypothetical protein
MVGKSTFHGTYHYYENINGKVKKVEKVFTDKKKYDEFMKKAPAMPSLGAFFGLGTGKKALPSKAGKPVKKASCKRCVTKKPVTKKKK